jgi:hypothetical protein
MSETRVLVLVNLGFEPNCVSCAEVTGRAEAAM